MYYTATIFIVPIFFIVVSKKRNRKEYRMDLISNYGSASSSEDEEECEY